MILELLEVLTLVLLSSATELSSSARGSTVFLEDFSLSATSIRYFFGWRTLIENRTIVRKIELSLVTAENMIKKLLLKINGNPYDILSLYVLLSNDIITI